MLGVPVAARSSQVFGAIPLSLTHSTFQLPHSGMAPVQLMLHLLSSTAGIISADVHSVPMHNLCPFILGARAQCAHVDSVLMHRQGHANLGPRLT